MQNPFKRRWAGRELGLTCIGLPIVSREKFYLSGSQISIPAIHKILNMRLRKTLLFVVVVLATSFGLKAQDMHNTLFYMNPIHMNPAFTGAYEGTFRIGGIYRDQARTVVTNAYSTPTIYGDAPIVMIGKRHWIGVGMLVFQDQAGDGKLRTTAGQLSGAFHYAMDKKSKNVLTLGVQWGRVTRSLEDVSSLRDGDLISQEQSGQLTPATTDMLLTGGSAPSPGGGSNPETSFQDINVGILLKSKVNKKTDYNMGVSMRHITTPGNDFNFGSSSIDLPMRFVAHAQLNTQLNEKWSLTPEAYFSSISPASQVQLHGWAGYSLPPKNDKEIMLKGGLGYRFGDSGQVLLGIDFGDIRAQLGYDLTLSELGKYNSRQGGFEIAVSYIGKIFKKPEIKPAILCPRL